MRLKSLEIQGFKTFPDKTKLSFEQGITSVVGPNGSGKSNISDAIRWVLGEQSPKSLRCAKMEDVVFNGTDKRKRQGYAEVTLNIDNKDRALDFNGDDIAVTRRYYRSGESEYLINKAAVRLKDINELFMDTVFKSSELIKSYGFSLGLQMMTGLYKSDIQKDLYTAETFVKINPDTVRIYPTVIMKDTKLAELYLNGEYTPYSLEKSVNLCSKLIELFEKNNIKIIRLGLHYSDSLVNNSYGDNYHPAFKELCENKLFYNKFIEKAKDFPDLNEIKTVVINSKSLSKFLGQKRSNVKKLNELGYNFSVCFDDTLQKYELYLK